MKVFTGLKIHMALIKKWSKSWGRSSQKIPMTYKASSIRNLTSFWNKYKNKISSLKYSLDIYFTQIHTAQVTHNKITIYKALKTLHPGEIRTHFYSVGRDDDHWTTPPGLKNPCSLC
jgi:hypothetical protein